jgi:hypothetical protein
MAGESWRPRCSQGLLATAGLTLIAAGLLISVTLTPADLVLCVLGVVAFWLPTPRRR